MDFRIAGGVAYSITRGDYRTVRAPRHQVALGGGKVALTHRDHAEIVHRGGQRSLVTEFTLHDKLFLEQRACGVKIALRVGQNAGSGTAHGHAS